MGADYKHHFSVLTIHKWKHKGKAKLLFNFPPSFEKKRSVCVCKILNKHSSIFQNLKYVYYNGYLKLSQRRRVLRPRLPFRLFLALLPSLITHSFMNSTNVYLLLLLPATILSTNMEKRSWQGSSYQEMHKEGPKGLLWVCLDNQWNDIHVSKNVSLITEYLLEPH